MTGLLPDAGVAETAQLGFRLLARRPWAMLASLLLLLLGTSTMLLIPPLLGAIVDVVIAGDGFASVFRIGGALAVAGTAAALLEWASGILLVRCLQAALSELREDVFEAALALPLQRIEAAGDADVISRITNDVEAVTEAISGVIPLCARAALTIVLTLIGMAVLDPWLALAALAAVPLQVWSTRVFLRRSRPLYARLRREEAERGREFVEAVSGADTVRAYGAHDRHLEAIARASATAVETHREATRARNRFNGGLNGAEFMGLAAVLAVGFVRVSTAGLSVGAVTAGALYFHRLFAPIGELLGSMDDLQRALSGLQRLVGVVQIASANREPVAEDRCASDAPVVVDQRLLLAETAHASVRIDGVHYRYGAHTSRAALSGAALEIVDGTTVALIGSSGSGKSTLARLIAGLDEPTAGQVLIGGVPATQAVRFGRPAVLLVAQETHVFSGSVSENLRLASPGASERELLAALAEVGFDPRRVEGGLDGRLSAASSHREAQQIALARVLLAAPAVVVLDEAVSAARADPILAEAVRAVCRGRTAVVIAHHLEQLRDVDLVAVLDDGSVQEVGSPEQLLARRGSAFAKLWRVARGERDPGS